MMTTVFEDVSALSCAASSFLKWPCATLVAVSTGLRSISLIVAPEEDRLRVVEDEEGRRKFEDFRRRIAVLDGVFELAKDVFEGDLLFDCRGVDERLSGYKGRELEGLWIGDCACLADKSMRKRGVSCDAGTGDDGGSGVAEALFKEACSRVG